MESLRVEVVYARVGHQEVVYLVLPPGATLRDAVDASGLLARHPEIDPESQPFGVFGERAAADTVLEDGDRIEIYRPLLGDPKQARRKRALRRA